MKFTILLLIAGLWISAEEVRAEEGMSMKDALSAMEQFVESCEPPPTKEQMVEILTNKRDASPESKCLRFCLLNQFEMFEDGSTQLKTDMAADMLDMAVPNKKELLKEIIDKCNTKNAAVKNGCEASHEHAFCVFDELKANNIEIPSVKED